MVRVLSLGGLCILLQPLFLFCALSAADAVSDLQTKGRAALDAQLAKSKTCTKDKLQIRREWGDLTAADRKAYIAAVQCITSAPSKLDQTKYPGAKTRFDDFVAVHINQTMNIHGTGSFLSWHRYFTFSYEQALRTECGYTGTQPYWDWGRWADSPETSPIFDGSDTSMGGNGEHVTHSSSGIKPAGLGGGCVKTGPFKNFTVNLGPLAAMPDTTPPRNPRTDGYGYNPRCLKRDLSNYLTTRYAKTSDIALLINSTATIGPFQDTMQAGTGVHGAGHFTISGDPGSDFYVSPGDPAFYLHHGMIDRTWSIWQTQDLANRLQVIAGGTSMMSWGATGRQQSLSDVVDLGVVGAGGKTWKISELVSTVDGPFCYAYESKY